MKTIVKRVAWFGAIVAALVVEPGEIEYSIAPPVANIQHKIFSATETEVCIRTSFKRKRKAQALSVSWTARSKGKTPVFLLMNRRNLPPGIMMANPDDFKGQIVYVNCHVRPKRFNGQPYTIKTRVTYEVSWQKFWEVYRVDPLVHVPGVK